MLLTVSDERVRSSVRDWVGCHFITAGNAVMGKARRLCNNIVCEPTSFFLGAASQPHLYLFSVSQKQMFD